jgi:hypothetical protein
MDEERINDFERRIMEQLETDCQEVKRIYSESEQMRAVDLLVSLTKSSVRMILSGCGDYLKNEKVSHERQNQVIG